MSRTPARFTQADIARAIRAAQQTGAGDVIVAPDGSIVIRSEKTLTAPRKELDEETVVPL
jgi:hypothetical protein